MTRSRFLPVLLLPLALYQPITVPAKASPGQAYKVLTTVLAPGSATR